MSCSRKTVPYHVHDVFNVPCLYFLWLVWQSSSEDLYRTSDTKNPFHVCVYLSIFGDPTFKRNKSIYKSYNQLIEDMKSNFTARTCIIWRNCIFFDPSLQIIEAPLERQGRGRKLVSAPSSEWCKGSKRSKLGAGQVMGIFRCQLEKGK